ncbi:MAG TPA: histidine kinase dimerization/phospho-acceptor domain-containing protein [candidate division Zixibacteria bacterium]|nr:histidine kinase dimerization/phospho-acceptor domain-containing protein [candidate division Zixibacteria bacterium]
MKRILVIDRSEALRETLGLLLEAEFEVEKSPAAGSLLRSGDTGREIDLLILGADPAEIREPSALLQSAARAPFPVLLLVDSRAAAREIESRRGIECLAKPFNPYELKRKVSTLLSSRRSPTVPSARQSDTGSGCLDFPFVTRAASTVLPRFATSGLPVLIFGEIGCGQRRVVRDLCRLANPGGPVVWLRAEEIAPEYLREKRRELESVGLEAGASMVVVENLERLSPAQQAALLEFLDEEELRRGRAKLAATAACDLLEKVYSSEFSEDLYAKLATLTVRLPPLRERSGDIPDLAAWFARRYGDALQLGPVALAPDAERRLVNYLWFGNLTELEMVIARTLAARRKSRIEAADLIFDFSPEPVAQTAAKLPAGSEKPSPGQWRAPADEAGANGRVPAVDLKTLIHELAHEFKNPMVTIKTFAQLLADRYQDEDFRLRFQDVVGGDIERMDDLLETMMEFSDFSAPRARRVSLEERLRAALDELQDECAKRDARIAWRGNGTNGEVLADDTQLKFAFKNVLAAVLSQIKNATEIEIDLQRRGALAISYAREGARVASIAQYFSSDAPDPAPVVLPLRLLLAKLLIERNGGRLVCSAAPGDREILEMEFVSSQWEKRI